MSVFHENLPNFSGQLISKLIETLFFSKNNKNAGKIDERALQDWNYDSALHFKASSFFDNVLISEKVPLDTIHYKPGKTIDANKKYDLIFADLPLLHFKSLVSYLIEIIDLMSPNGITVGLFTSLNQIKSLDKLGSFDKLGIFPASIMQLYKGFFGSITSINPILVCFCKRDKFNLISFLEFKETDNKDNISNFIDRHRGIILGEKKYLEYIKNEKRDSNSLIGEVLKENNFNSQNLYLGFFESLNNFHNFDLISFIPSFNEIDSDFKNYKKCFLEEVSERFKVTNNKFQENENAIYIALIGTQEVIQDLNFSKIKHQNLCQVILDKNKVLPSYLLFYLNSKYGKMFWEAAKKSKTGLIPRLNKSDIQKLLISLPPLELQKKISEVSIKIKTAKDALDSIQDSLASHPVSSQEQLLKLDSILDSISEVSPLLVEESITHEFKASLRTPYPEIPKPEKAKNGKNIFKLGNQTFESIKQIQLYLENIVLKSIASFLNTYGGTLVIGIHERANKKNVVGIDRENFESHDLYERHLAQLFINKFGPHTVSKNISTKIVNIEGQFVCIVKCNKLDGDDIVFLDDNVYVRTGPRVDKLTTKQVAELVKNKQRK